MYGLRRCLLLVLAWSLHTEQALAQFDSLLKKASETFIGKPIEVAVDIPSCLVELQGGIARVEDTLLDGIKKDQRWMVLVTSSQDRLTAAATMSYYEAVNEACPPTLTPSQQTVISSEEPFEDSNGIKSLYESGSLAGWKFAHLSFDDEPSLIWRWWIWKVPIILFISSPTQNQMPYDIRYWKIAFELPRKERIHEVIEGGTWRNLPVWQSSLAPGGALASIPSSLGHFFGIFYNVLDLLPNWLLTILATAGGSLLISFLHGGRA